MSSGARIVRDGGAFVASPWRGPDPAEGWDGILAIYAGESPDGPAMLGEVRRDGERLIFQPRFAPTPAVRVRAVFYPPGERPVVAWFGGVPSPPRAPVTFVSEVTPTSPVWPENILRLYVTFSAPMRIGVAWDHIRLLDEAGDVVPGPFVEIDQELWDPEGRRITILFDPARIKRGLVDHRAEGLPLIPGRRYTLEIDPGWRDAEGRPLTGPYRQSLEVEPAWRDRLDPELWILAPPSEQTAPLTVRFDRPVDAALALRSLTVERGGEVVDGVARLSDHERCWSFTPSEPWRTGRYMVHAAAILEDIAGNRIARAFDTDVREAQPPARAAWAELAFHVL